MPAAAKELPSVEYLNSELELREGELYWKTPRRGRFMGKPAGCVNPASGYRQVRLDGVARYSHRMIYKMAHGVDPEHIDHIDGDRLNNHPDNLRSVSQQTNNRNKGPSPRNTSGYRGVYWCKNMNKWKAYVKNKGKYVHLGYFDDLAIASELAELCREEIGYTKRGVVA